MLFKKEQWDSTALAGAGRVEGAALFSEVWKPNCSIGIALLTSIGREVLWRAGRGGGGQLGQAPLPSTPAQTRRCKIHRAMAGGDCALLGLGCAGWGCGMQQGVGSLGMWECGNVVPLHLQSTAGSWGLHPSTGRVLLCSTHTKSEFYSPDGLTSSVVRNLLIPSSTWPSPALTPWSSCLFLQGKSILSQSKYCWS